MMWRTRNIYEDIYHGRMEVEDRFTKHLPDWPALWF
jgi:stearoyl-CoA desaturase (delta-9 desaturase)